MHNWHVWGNVGFILPVCIGIWYVLLLLPTHPGWPESANCCFLLCNNLVLYLHP